MRVKLAVVNVYLRSGLNRRDLVKNSPESHREAGKQPPKAQGNE
jgi:hypothetical protein